jgi:hypothetical protein
MTDQVIHDIQDYGISDKRVESFIQRNPELRQLLGDAYAQIQRYFPKTQCRLQFYIDPETGHEQLVLLIETDLNFEVVMNLLDQFRHDWWLDNLHRAESKLIIIPEYL